MMMENSNVITQEGKIMLENPLILFDNYPASAIAQLGIRPPSWKKNHKTYAEALQASREALEKYEPVRAFDKVDYSQWK